MFGLPAFDEEGFFIKGQGDVRAIGHAQDVGEEGGAATGFAFLGGGGVGVDAHMLIEVGGGEGDRFRVGLNEELAEDGQRVAGSSAAIGDGFDGRDGGQEVFAWEGEFHGE